MIGLIDTAFRIYEAVILVRVLFSWINLENNHPVVVWVYRLTEPVLEPIRRLIPMQRLGIDISPVILLLLLELVKQGLFRIL